MSSTFSSSEASPAIRFYINRFNEWAGGKNQPPALSKGESMYHIARRAPIAIFTLALTLCLGGCSAQAQNQVSQDSTQPATQSQAAETSQQPGSASGAGQISPASSFNYADVPDFTGAPSVQINGNVPYFTADDIAYAESNPGFESYGEQDGLARCTTCWASVGTETMPTAGEERGEIGQVKPTGWHTVKYDSVEGRYLYNRCHLIGWQLTDENANIDNLITGTRFMNVDGMLPYENEVASYVRSTGNHVLYRVTPVFAGDELVARGVLMEAYSVEDKGASLAFCVWAYNAQPGIQIDYADGNSSEMAALPAAGESSASAEQASGTQAEQAQTYVLNTSSKKFHLPSCDSAAKISDTNRSEQQIARSELIAQGYEPCGRCNP